MRNPPGLVPGPMTKRRMALMQARAENHQPIAVASDRAEIQASIERRSRHKSQRRDGFHTAARKVGGRSNQTAESKFDEDGDAIGSDPAEQAWERYFNTKPGSDEARIALAECLRLRGLS